MVQEILQAYNLDEAACHITSISSGLINPTWKISNGREFILQRVNENVFKNPHAIAQNLRLLSDYFSQHHPGYYFTAPVKTANGDEMAFIVGQGYFRMFHFVPNSHSYNVVHSTKQAFEAAKQFGKFTRLLANINIDQLQPTIPDFHNLTLRYQQFEKALKEGNKERQKNAADSLVYLQQHKTIVDVYEDLKKSAQFKLRVTHHDTKISNVLFDADDNGLCVIDLDTVMPGYFISDVGDMLRTYLSPVSEEEKDFSKITIREEYFEAIARGYLSEMQDELSAEEKAHFVYAGKFMLYMQALRFVTDYLNNDRYYGCAYEDQNLVRTNNQITLLRQLNEREPQLQALVMQVSSKG